MKFTFKKWFDGEGAEIKLRRRICGWYQMVFEEGEYRWIVYFHKSDEGDKKFRSVRLKVFFMKEKDCRLWIQEHTEAIIRSVNLYFFD